MLVVSIFACARGEVAYLAEAKLDIGLLNKWTTKLSENEMRERFILRMAYAGFHRYRQQADTATEITGSHALANCTILHYLVQHGALKVVEEDVEHQDEKFQVIGLKLQHGLRVAMNMVQTLMNEVQRIKSTADGEAAQYLLSEYGRKIMFPKQMKSLKRNMQRVMGQIKGVACLFPIYEPVLDKDGEMIDVTYRWPQDIFDQHKQLQLLMEL